MINICTDCYHDLPTLPHHCTKCACFLPRQSQFQRCGQCLTQPTPFRQVFALLPYSFPVDSLVSQLKFQRQLSHAALFGHLLATKASNVWYRNQPMPDLIIPVPLHATRHHQRGFNQAFEIARVCAKQMSLPLNHQGLARIRPTQPQSTLSRRQRAHNMQHAFKANHAFTNLHVALVDDVMTTGQTILACAKTLQQAGAKHIDIWCCARRG